MVDAEIQIAQFWTMAKNKMFDLENFLNIRKKRLCVTLMFLCDLTPYDNLDLIDIGLLKEFGDYYETKGNLLNLLN